MDQYDCLTSSKKRPYSSSENIVGGVNWTWPYNYNYMRGAHQQPVNSTPPAAPSQYLQSIQTSVPHSDYNVQHLPVLYQDYNVHLTPSPVPQQDYNVQPPHAPTLHQDHNVQLIQPQSMPQIQSNRESNQAPMSQKRHIIQSTQTPVPQTNYTFHQSETPRLQTNYSFHQSERPRSEMNGFLQPVPLMNYNTYSPQFRMDTYSNSNYEYFPITAPDSKAVLQSDMQDKLNCAKQKAVLGNFQRENCVSFLNTDHPFGSDVLKTPPKQIIKSSYTTNTPQVFQPFIEAKREHFNFEREKSIALLGKSFREKFEEDNSINTESNPGSELLLNQSLSNKFLEIESDLSRALLSLDYSATCITHISNPIDHAWDPHQNFINKFMDGPKSILFLGMNPGPWGMSQTGVPFGQVEMCKDWLKVTGHVVKPVNEHPKRPILGFNCTRNEVSGRRFWSFFQSLSGTPEKFFEDCMVYNHCPLAFMKESGKNVTPPEIKIEVRKSITELCDKALAEIIGLLGVKMVVGIGKFSEGRAKAVVKAYGLVGVEVKFLMHPSPLNPLANKGWNEIAEKTLMGIGIYSKLEKIHPSDPITQLVAAS